MRLTHFYLEEDERKRLLENRKKVQLLSVAGVLLLIAACGQESAEDIIDNSIQAYEEVESFHMTMEQSMDFDEEEGFELTTEADMTLDPFTMEQTMFIEDEEMRIRFVDGAIYLEEPMSGTWLQMEEDLDELMGEVYGVDGFDEEELAGSENLVPLLEELREREEGVTVEETDDDGVHILSYSAEGEEAQELVMGLDLGEELEIEDLLAEEDGNMHIDHFDVTLTFDAETYYILEQDTQFSGTFEDEVLEEERNYTQEILATYSEFDAVEPIEAPEDAVSFTDFLNEGFEDSFEDDFELEDEMEDDDTDEEAATGSVTAFDSVTTSVDSYDVLTSLMLEAPEGEFLLNEEGTVNGYLEAGHFHLDGGTDGEENVAEIYWDYTGEYHNDNNQGWEAVDYSPIGIDSLYEDVVQSLIEIYSSHGATTEEDTLVSLEITDEPLDDETVVSTIHTWLESVADPAELGIDFQQDLNFELTTALTDDQQYIERVLFNLEQDGTILYFEYIYSDWDEAEEVTVPDEVLEEAGA